MVASVFEEVDGLTIETVARESVFGAGVVDIGVVVDFGGISLTVGVVRDEVSPLVSDVRFFGVGDDSEGERLARRVVSPAERREVSLSAGRLKLRSSDQSRRSPLARSSRRRGRSRSRVRASPPLVRRRRARAPSRSLSLLSLIRRSLSAFREATRSRADEPEPELGSLLLGSALEGASEERFESRDERAGVGADADSDGGGFRSDGESAERASPPIAWRARFDRSRGRVRFLRSVRSRPFPVGVGLLAGFELC